MAADALFEEFVDAVVEFSQGEGSFAFYAGQEGSNGFDVGCFEAFLLVEEAAAEGEGLAEGKGFFDEECFCVLEGGCGEVIYAAADGPGTVEVGSGYEAGVVVAVEEVPAYFEFFVEFGFGDFADVGVSVVGPVAAGVVVHCLAEGTGDADVVDDEASFFVAEDAVYPGDCLHEVVAAHGFVDVHGGQGGDVKSGEPHVDDDCYFEGVGVVFEFFCHFVAVGFGSDDLPPFFWVGVCGGHDEADFFLPFGAEVEDFAVDFHGDVAGVGDDHCFAGEFVLPVGFVVVDDVEAEGFDGLGCSEDAFKPAELVFAFVDDVFGGFFCEDVVFLVDELEDVFVEVEVDDAAFVVDGAGCAVLDGLGHVVDVDVVAEDFAGVFVFGGDGGSGESDVCCVGEVVADFSCGSDDDFSGFVVDFFFEAVLAAVGFVGDDDDVFAGGEGFGGFFELLHGGEDDAVRLSSRKEVFEVAAAFCLYRGLSEEVFAVGELAEELVVEVVSVGDDDDGGALEGGLEEFCVEDHGEGFSAALCVPEDAAFSVGLGGGYGGLDSFFDGEVLVVCCEDFGVVVFGAGVADEVFEDVDEAVFLEDSFEEDVEGGVTGGFVVAVGGFPFHVPVFVCGDGAGFGGGLVAHDAEGVVGEEGGDVVEVVAELEVGFGDVGVFAGGGFEFDDDDRDAVYEDDDVGAFFCVVNDGPLVDDGEGVVVGVVVVDELDEVAAFFGVVVFYGDAVLEVVGCDDVFVDEG